MADVVRQHDHAIHCRARQVCGDDRATDVAQEVYLRFWQDPFRYEPSKGPLGSFLMMMTTGIAIDLVRRDARRRARDETAGRDVATRPSLDQPDVADPVTSRRVQEALSSLNADQRDVVVASIVHELVHREIAITRGIPEGTVKSRIRLGIHRLRDQLRDVHEPPEPAACR
jgi:RNA polymerase sigma-70 factor, ECF subfamily